MLSRAVRREELCKLASLASVGRARGVWATLGLPRSRHVRFPRLHCSGPRLLCSGTKAGPVLRALPRSEPLRFRFSGTPQRRRLGWACILCTPQVRAAQAPCACRAHCPRWAVRLITSLVPGFRFPGCTMRLPTRVCCVSPLGS